MAAIYQIFWLPCLHCARCLPHQAAAETKALKVRQLSDFIGMCYSNITSSCLKRLQLAVMTHLIRETYEPQVHKPKENDHYLELMMIYDVFTFSCLHYQILEMSLRGTSSCLWFLMLPCFYYSLTNIYILSFLPYMSIMQDPQWVETRCRGSMTNNETLVWLGAIAV